jgi:ABC-type dipeptide/oligopeptide/nickel transport system permease component
MASYIIRRLLLMIPTLIGVTMVVFFVMALSPGGVGGTQLMVGAEIDPAARQAMREYYNRRYGLNQPIFVQYGKWLNRVSPVGFATDPSGNIQWRAPQPKWPDLGESMSRRRPVIDLYREALPITLLLNVITISAAYTVAIIAGVYMARYRGRIFDVATGTTFLGLWSIPVIWMSVMAIGFLANRDYVQWFPTGGLNSTLASEAPFLPAWDGQDWNPGWLLDRMWHLVLPVICLAYTDFAFLSKLMRSSTLENLSTDFVRTARAKGVAERSVLFRHAVRNSLLPLITVAASILPAMIGGAVIVESIFSIPGMGKLTLDAIFARDRELVLAGTLVSGVLGLLSILIADLSYVIADPRVSYE